MFGVKLVMFGVKLVMFGVKLVIKQALKSPLQGT